MDSSGVAPGAVGSQVHYISLTVGGETDGLLKSWTDGAVVGRSRVRTANRPHAYSNRLMSLTQIAGLSCRKGGRGCLKKKQSNVLRKTPARENLPAHRQENLYGRRCTTCGRGSMGRRLQNRLLR